MIRARRHLHLVSRAVAVLALAAALVTLGFYAAPALQSPREILREVDTAPVQWRRLPDGGAQVDDLVLEKLPPPCRFIAWRWLAGRGDLLRPVEVTRPGHVPGPSRPAGLQSFGPVRIVGPLPAGPLQVRAVWWYWCGDDLTETPVELGPWVVP